MNLEKSLWFFFFINLLNKELVVYTLFFQVMGQGMVLYFYPSKLVPDILEYYENVRGKSL